MKFRITILCENSVGPISGTLGEHGFSALIEPSQGEPLLFDTGQGLTLLHNAQRMDKDLSAVGNVVLSHGHYDHCGGLLPLLTEYGPKQIHAHPGIFTPRFRLKDTGECYPIGITHSRDQLEAAGGTFELSKEFREIAPGMSLTGEVPRVTAFEAGCTATAPGRMLTTRRMISPCYWRRGGGWLLSWGAAMPDWSIRWSTSPA